jgi:hypothetical protein
MALTRRLTNFTSIQNGVSGTFDVDLYIPSGGRAGDMSSNASIIITLKIFLRQKNNGDGRPGLTAPFSYATWPADKWEAFKTQFADGANFWNNKFWLVLSPDKVTTVEYRAVEQELAVLENAPSRETLQQKYVYRRNLKCRFNLQIVSEAGAAHKTLDCLYIVDGSNQPTTNPYTHRSDAATIDVGDVHESGGFNCISHEVGHMLGLAHIGVVTAHAPCMAVISSADGPNSAVCYDGENNTYTNNVMGHGNLLTYHQSLPWRRAFERMSGIPLEYYIVHPIPYSPQSGGMPELITERTPRWRVFMPNTSSVSFVDWRPGARWL